MTRKEFVDSLKEVSIKDKVRATVIEVYGSDVPEIILRILSQFPSPILFDENESRTLSLNEVLHAEEDNMVPLKSKELIPIADIGNNDWIVYDGEKKMWWIYNILDETLYDEAKDFESLFLK